ncbi:thiamine pyrophosphate-requiring protein [Nocardiopsis baichengensis]|uniref:thiamine pyrophosphate-requiring protein n=1 Tax=Nocardiopsis baichengensis TaxID=280240 RepID=UPI00034717FE|nr:thiamine pyrophosphate-requiring protein [Nocardiopsis baichengensis]
MAEKVSDLLLKRLREWGVEHVFGYPGDGINGLLAAWDRAGDRPRFLQARHEELAAFEAAGYAKFSGRVGVCAATSGPGAVHLLNGLYDAKLDHVPVVAIVGQTDRSGMGGSMQQEVDLHALYKDVAAQYLTEVTVPQQLPNALDRAMRVAESRRTVTAVIIPADVQELDYVEPGHAFKMVPGTLGTARSVTVPDRDALNRAADVLNAGNRVAVMVGQGARGAREQIAEAADLLGAGVAKALLGKDVISDEEPYVTGAAGLLGTRPSYEMMRDCDTLLMVGSGFPYSQYLPEYGQARGVQIDIDPAMLGLRYPFEVPLPGDARETLRELLPLLERKRHRGWRETIEQNVRRWWQVQDRRAGVPADPVNPELVAHELSPRLPDDAIVTADSGSATNWYARHLRFRAGIRGSVSGSLATMGCAVPYAVGAKFAHPDRPVIAMAGDGAMQMNGMNELITAALHAEQWSDPRLVVAVFDNGDLNQVTWEMRAMGASPQFVPSQRLPRASSAAFARSLGLTGIRVEEPDRVGEAWDEALAARGPAVVEFATDPSVPPIPPTATWDQMESMTAALAKGDPEAWSVLAQGVRSKAQEFLPGSRR